MKWCMWCGEELKMDSRRGWVHQDGSIYKPDGHCVTLTDKSHAMLRKKRLESAKREWLPSEERDTKTIAGKFAEALGCLEDALCWLEQVNKQYDPGEEYIVDCRLAPRNRAMDFWLQAELAEDALKVMLGRLQRVEPLIPKEVSPLAGSLLTELVEAIGRHPAVEDDPAVIDAINAIGKELAGEPT